MICSGSSTEGQLPTGVVNLARQVGECTITRRVTVSSMLLSNEFSISVDAKTSGGAIRLGRAGGSVEARTTGGSIHIGDAGGHAVAHTTGGSIQLGDVGGTLDVKTTGGSIRATLAQQPEGDSRLRTTGGSIELAVAEEVGVDIDARTTGGRVSSDLHTAAPVPESKSALVSPVNGGGPKLTLRTTGGSIRLRTP